MSTQRREDRATLSTEDGRGAEWSVSWFARSKDRAGILGKAFPSSAARSLAANRLSSAAALAELPIVIPDKTLWLGIAEQAATNSLRSDRRNEVPVRPSNSHPERQSAFRMGRPFGSPPVGQAAARRPLVQHLSGDLPMPSSAESARLYPTLPRVPAAIGCRTERYDGKGNLHFKHAA